jgi:hypothetical protein
VVRDPQLGKSIRITVLHRIWSLDRLPYIVV